MTPALATSRALALDIRRVDTAALVGIALVVPSERLVSFLGAGAREVTIPVLSAETWRGIDAWADETETRLPFRPAPMTSALVEPMLDTAPGPVVAERFASIPLDSRPGVGLGLRLARMLPGLLKRRTATA
jgi:hypothetical protein